MRVNYDRIFIDSFTANLLQSVMVKNFENRLAFCRVTGKNKVAPLFSGHGVDVFCTVSYCTAIHDDNFYFICTKRCLILRIHV